METAAADRRGALRTAFIRLDPRLTGLVAPYLVPHTLRALHIDVSPETIARFTQVCGEHGKPSFQWIRFCEALERELTAFLARHGRPSSARSTAASASPRGRPQSAGGENEG